MKKSIFSKVAFWTWQEWLAYSGFLLYVVWALVPAIPSRVGGTVVAILCVLLSMLGVFLDKDISHKEFLGYMVRYAAAGLVMTFLWQIGRKYTNGPFSRYYASAFLLWYPLPFSAYIIKKRDITFRNVARVVMLVCITVTCITTLLQIGRYPQAPRLLAGHATPEESLKFSLLNIAGYGFIYMSALLIPMLFGFAVKSRPTHKIAYMILTVLIIFTAIFAQYLMSIYMIILCILVLATYFIIKYLSRNIRLFDSDIKRILVAIPVAILLFIANFSSINSGMYRMFDYLGLGTLTQRIDSVDEIGNRLETIVTFDNNAMRSAHGLSKTNSYPFIYASISLQTQARPVQDDDLNDNYIEAEQKGNEFSGPLGARVRVYMRLLETAGNNWLTGNLLSKNVTLSGHSEILDLLLGGGLIGSIIVIGLLYIMFRDLYASSIALRLRPFSLLMLLMALGLGMLNTLTHSREIWLVLLTTPFLIGMEETDKKEEKHENTMAM